eukprot:gene10333-2748_t
MLKKYSSAFGVTLGFLTGSHINSLQIHKEKLEHIKFDSIEQRFFYFSDVQKENERFMSPTSFMKSILVTKPKLPVWVAHPRKNGELLTENSMKKNIKLQRLLSMVDANSDGLISLHEYQFFNKILNCHFSDFKFVFNLFHDEISSKDLCKILKVDIDFSNFFRKDILNFDDFYQIVNSLKMEVIRQEFKNYDTEGNGLISVESFSQLITSSMHFHSISNVPSFKKKLNVLKTNGFLKPSGRINLQTFKSFHLMSETSEEIGRALKIYSEGERSIGKNEFKRAVHVTTGLILDSKVIDLVFALFDENNEGNLQYDKFVDILKTRKEKKPKHKFEEIVN